MDDIKKSLFGSLLKLLRPLVKLLIRHGVSHSEFADLAKQVYVRVAEEETEFQIDGRKQTGSRISVLTGINRKEVARIQALGDSQQLDVVSHNRAAQVVNGWLIDPNYKNAEGEPAELSIGGDDEFGFESLVKEYSGDMPVRAVLDELTRVGAVQNQANGKLRLSSKAYIPQASDAEKLQMLGTSVTDLLNTLDHNIPCSIENSRLQLTLAYDNLPQEALEEFKQLSEKQAEETLLRLNDWLSRQDRSINPSVKGTGRYRAGLGIYYFEESKKDENNEV